MPYRFQKVYGIPCKPRYALAENDVNFSYIAVGKHTNEFVPVGCTRAAYTAIRIYARIIPFGVVLYQGAVVAYLCGNRIHKPLRIPGNPCVSGHFFTLWQGGDRRLYPADFLH